MTSDVHATPATETDAKPAAKRTPYRPDVTDKAAREILAAERHAQLAKTERLRAARLAAQAAEPAAAPAPKRRGGKAAN